jgi:hypothetical protein
VTGCAFSLGHYRELIESAQTGGYRFVGFDREPSAGDLFLRHDVDLSLDAAVVLAEIENEAGVSSTWFLMTRSAFYNLDSEPSAAAVERLRTLGGRIAHHAVWPHLDLDARFEHVVAWHNPEPDYMQAPIAGASNVMSAPWFTPTHYRSDSNQSWRGECPHDALARGAYDWLQLLVHPEIWAYDGATMESTMESFLQADLTRRRELLRADRIDLS